LTVTIPRWLSAGYGAGKACKTSSGIRACPFLATPYRRSSYMIQRYWI